RESLWGEAVELMLRAGRPLDAADYLAGWAKPRPADESVAGWRSRLYAQAGAAERALAVEKEALAAFEREAAGDDAEQNLDERRSRAIHRLMDYGLPRQALLVAGGDMARLGASALDWSARADLALRNDKMGSFLRVFGHEAEARSAAASALQERGRPEQREEA